MLACWPTFFLSASCPKSSPGSYLWQLLPITGSRWPNRACLGLCWCRSPTPPQKPRTALHRAEFGFSPQNEVTPPPLGGGVGYHLFWVRRVCPARSQPGHSGPTGPVWGFDGVVPLPRPLTGHKSPHRAEFGSHRLFLVCFGFGRVDKSFSSL